MAGNRETEMSVDRSQVLSKVTYSFGVINAEVTSITTNAINKIAVFLSLSLSLSEGLLRSLDESEGGGVEPSVTLPTVAEVFEERKCWANQRVTQ